MYEKIGNLNGVSLIHPLNIALNWNKSVKYFIEILWDLIQLTRWTLYGECTSAGLSQPALALPSPCFDESDLPASFHCHYATHSGPRRPAGSLAHRTSCSWNLQWLQSVEILVRQRNIDFSGHAVIFDIVYNGRTHKKQIWLLCWCLQHQNRHKNDTSTNIYIIWKSPKHYHTMLGIKY